MLLERLAVLVDIAQIGLDDDGLRGQLAMEFGVFRSVERYKLVGHDATAAIDDAMLFQRLVAQ